jgi:superfamily II DNA helicase RecQ
MMVRVITLRYSEGLQGFSEDAIREACGGREVLASREHFFLHGNIPHLALVLELGDGPGNVGARRGREHGFVERPDLEVELPEPLRPLYRELRRWRNERAKKDGIPSYVVMRNRQLAEICMKLPRTLAALKEIEGIGEASCEKYGREILTMIPPDAAPPDAPASESPA